MPDIERAAFLRKIDRREVRSPYLADVIISHNCHQAQHRPADDVLGGRLPVLESQIDGCEFVYSLGPYLRFGTSTTHRYSAILREYKPHDLSTLPTPRPHTGLLCDLLVYALRVLNELDDYSMIALVPPKLGEPWSTYHLGSLLPDLRSFLARQTKCDVQYDALSFVRPSPAVKTLPTQVRFAAVHFGMASNPIVANASVLVVDDILASGATVREAARALRAAGATRVAALSLAKRVL